MSIMLSLDFDFLPFVLGETGASAMPIKRPDGSSGSVHPMMCFDWGHNEGHASLLQAILWQTRYACLLNHGYDPEKEVAIRPLDQKCVSIDKFIHDVSRKIGRWEDAPLWYADSHAHGLTVAQAAWIMNGKRPITILHFDAHSDLAYSEGMAHKARTEWSVDCGSWLYGCLAMGLTDRVRVVYPDWKDASRDKPTKAKSKWLKGFWRRIKFYSYSEWLAEAKPDSDRVLFTNACRSSSWTPPWLDADFERLISLIPRSYAKCLDCDKRYQRIGGHDACKRRAWSREDAQAYATQRRELWTAGKAQAGAMDAPKPGVVIIP